VTVGETARLRLRQLAGDDAPFILELLNDTDFLANVGDRGVHNLDDARRYIAGGPLASYQQHGFGLYLVELKVPALAIGLCGLLRREVHPDVEIGFAFLPHFRRQGYALEAAEWTVRLAARMPGLTRLVALTAPDNSASIRILERLGLRFESMVSFTELGGQSRLFALDISPAAGERPSP